MQLRLIQASISAGVVTQGATVTLSIDVDPASEVSFLMQFGSGDIELELESPSGKRIDAAVAADDANIEYEAVGNTDGAYFKAYSIRNPEAGRWTMHIFGKQVINEGGQEAFFVTTQMSGSAVTLEASLDKSTYMLGDNILIAAALAEDYAPILQASVYAKVALPDGSGVKVALQDSGTDGDTVANDGTYTGQYSGTSQDGAYRIVVTAVSNGGTAFKRDELLIATVALSESDFGTSFSDSAEDTDSNGLYEDLLIRVGVDVKSSAQFRFVGEIYDKYGEPVTSASVSTSLPEGQREVELV